MDKKIITLFGSKKITLSLKDETTKEFTIRQFALSHYDSAFKLIDDEIGLVAKACGVSRDDLDDLKPESYEELLATFKEVNASGFFPFAARQKLRVAEFLGGLPTDLIEQAMARKLSTSLTPSPHIPPPQG